MSNLDGVLEAIDACLNDVLSPDAMRWAPDEPDPTPQNDLADRVSEWVEEHTGFQLPEWQRHYLNALTPTVEAGTLTWDSDLTPPREAILDSIGAELETPSRDGLLRITMPDSSESCHRVVAVTPGETPGEYVLTLEPAARSAFAALGEFADELQRGAQRALEGFGKAFTPMYDAVQSSLHRSAYRGVRGHKRRCPTCNPYAFPKPLAINGHEYNRRRRRRGRR